MYRLLFVFAIALATASPSDAKLQGEPLLGEIRSTARNFCPHGWVVANGDVLLIDSNPALYSLYGYSFGGNGTSTFALPDLRGRVPMGTGQHPSSPNTIRNGDVRGARTYTLSAANLPPHGHGLQAHRGVATGRSAEGDMFAETADGNVYSTLAPSHAMHAATIAMAGQGRPFQLTQPYLVINYCISVDGEYPSFN